MSDSAKDTIYIDVDEEITGIVSKVQASSKSIVALVLPKRAAVLQSVVNMKLLKRTSEQAKKKVVLITSDSKILPLAGAAGMFVASNLTSKPYVPLSPDQSAKAAPASAVEEIDPDTPVSKLAPDAKFADSSDDGIEIDNTKPKVAAAATAAGKASKDKKDKKLKVPNFSSFRKRLLIGGVALLFLIFLLIWAFALAPKATITVNAKTSDVPISLDLTGDTEADNADLDNNTIRASKLDSTKDDSETVPATGEKNNGNKASGSVSMTARKCGGNPFNAPSSVPAGTGVSSNGVTFITQRTTSFTTNGAQPDSQPNCYSYPSNGSTSIIAQSGGKNGNISGGDFDVSGRNDVSASGSTNGGTDDIVKVVSAKDVDKAKERLNSKKNTAEDDLKKQLNQSGFVPVEDSFKANDPKYIPSPSVGSQANDVTVNVTAKYTIVGLNKEDLQNLIKKAVQDQANGSDQSILSDGLSNVEFKMSSEPGDDDTTFQVSMSTTAIAGPDVNQDELKGKLAGKSSDEAKDILNGIKGYENPEVDLSPFWVSKVPKASKITINVKQADGSAIP